MNLRFIMRDGQKILQHQIIRVLEVDSGNKTYEWVDVPLVEEPRKPREFTIEFHEDQEFMRCWATQDTTLMSFLKYTGTPPDIRRLIKVIEVLE